jgi:3-oxoacyl-[acyl-carrier protein] reductase
LIRFNRVKVIKFALLFFDLSMIDLDFQGKTAVVCGGSSGIGKAIALEFAKANANVIIVARDEVKLEEVLSQLSKKVFQHHSYVVADFSVPSFLRKILERKFHGINVDILINNSGGPAPGLASFADVSDFERAFTNHVIGSQLLTQHFTEGMKERRFGRIINIISTSVKEPISGLGVSNTIRGAMAGWSKTISKELAPFGITVNNVLPGSTEGSRIEALISNRSAVQNKPEEDIRAAMLQDIPVGRFAKPEEIANAVLFLASNSSAYINGVNLAVDGGKMSSI